MAMNQADLHVSNLDHFGLWELSKVIELSSHSVHLRFGSSKGLKPLLGLYVSFHKDDETYLFGSEISRRQDILHLVGQQKLLELFRDAYGSLRDVQIADDKDELT